MNAAEYAALVQRSRTDAKLAALLERAAGATHAQAARNAASALREYLTRAERLENKQ